MSSFIDLLRSAPSNQMHGYLRIAKYLALRDQADSVDAAELTAWFGDAESPLLTDESYRKMTHFRVKDALTDICETMPSHYVKASYPAFRALTPCYSLEIDGWLTFIVIAGTAGGLTALACARTTKGLPQWCAMIRTSSEHLAGDIRTQWNPEADHRELGIGSREDAVRTMLRVLATTSAVITIPGLYVASTSAPCQKLQTARKRRKRFPLVETIDFNVDRPKIASDGKSSGEAAAKAERVRHQVIGHFRLLTKDRPEPVLSFVHSHWRGRTENGIRFKNYDVGASSIPFTPPTLKIETPAQPE